MAETSVVAVAASAFLQPQQPIAITTVHSLPAVDLSRVVVYTTLDRSPLKTQLQC
jgi:hypothetical protein